MIELHCVKKLGDSTLCYEVHFNKEYTVKEFLDFVMSKENEANWGKIHIHNDINSEIEVATVRYSKLLKEVVISWPHDEYDSCKIIKAHANGGWGSMDYYLTIKAN